MPNISEVGSPSWRKDCWDRKAYGTPCAFCGRIIKKGEKHRTVKISEGNIGSVIEEELLHVILCVKCEVELTENVLEISKSLSSFSSLNW